MDKNIQHPRFNRVKNNEFSKILRVRVSHYFKSNNISRNANANMVIKTIVMLTLFFVPLAILCTVQISQAWLVFTLYIVSGLGMAGIGMGVMHDAIHGSYSNRKYINTLLGYTFNLIGANATIWKIQHNILHHTYTNIDEADDDINMPFFLRFSPHAKHYKIHKFQYIYIWFFYSISTLAWITVKDFIRLYSYKSKGFLKAKNQFRNALIAMTIWKLIYFAYALVVPIMINPLAWWIILLAFITMHLLVGLLVSIVFQIAHIMPSSKFPLPNKEGIIENDWYRHQFRTTTNFSPKSKILFWLIGGLNYQVEHHVMPDVCHIHYRNISTIVANTAKEFEIPYHVKRNLRHAIGDHIKMLKILGKETGSETT